MTYERTVKNLSVTLFLTHVVTFERTVKNLRVTTWPGNLRLKDTAMTLR